MTLTTRPPTGLPSWPILLVAGAEKSGKSWSCAQASASTLIDRTLWIGVGEDDPDEYGHVPGARFEIVIHDGSYRGILRAITEAAALPVGEKPNLLVLDSATRLWELLCEIAQQDANRRAANKASRSNRPAPDDDVQITMDLWNVAKDRWQHIISVLRGHQGPSVITARLDEVTVLDRAGKPTQEKTLKVKAEKSLPYDVGGVVQLPERGKAYLTGVRSARIQLEGRKEIKDFTVEGLWRDLGLADGPAGERTHSGALTRVTDNGWWTSWQERLAAVENEDALRDLYAELIQVHEQDDVSDEDRAIGGQQINEGKRRLEQAQQDKRKAIEDAARKDAA